jgi:hypothetical protein
MMPTGSGRSSPTNNAFPSHRVYPVDVALFEQIEAVAMLVVEFRQCWR